MKIISSLIAMPVAIASCLGTPAAAPEPVIPLCPHLVWTSWSESDIPDCDLNGTQTWASADELTDLVLDDYPQGLERYCNDGGGVFAVNVAEPVTVYCFNWDY